MLKVNKEGTGGSIVKLFLESQSNFSSLVCPPTVTIILSNFTALSLTVSSNLFSLSKGKILVQFELKLIFIPSFFASFSKQSIIV